MRSSSTSCSRSARGFIILFVAVTLGGLAWAEWILRDFIFDDKNAAGSAIMPMRVAAVYEQRIWPLMGDSRLGDILIGDSQMYTGFVNHHAEFFQLSIHAETAPMLEILTREYLRFRTPGRAIVEAGPQLFAPQQLERGAWRHDTYFNQNNWLQHRLGVRLYVAEPGVGSFIGDVLGPRMASMGGLIGAARAADEEDSAAPRVIHHWGDYPKHERDRQTRKRISIQRPADDFEGTSHSAAYMRMLRHLAERGAQICILRMPVSAEYLELAKGDRQFAKALDYFRRLGAQYGRYVDFLDLPIAWKAEHFANQDHLGEAGVAASAPLATKACFPD